MRRTRASLTAILITAGLGVLALVAPVAAQRIVDYARNADKVDGFHAVPKSAEDRSRRLVATDRNGYLPNDVIRIARDSARLDGSDSTAFQRWCGQGSVLAWATVPVHLTVTENYISSTSTNPPGFNCADREQGVLYRQVDTGVYRVKFPGFEDNTDDILLRYPLVATITPVQSDHRPERGPVMASYAVVRDGAAAVLEVSIYDADGAPRNSGFSVTLVHGTG